MCDRKFSAELPVPDKSKHVLGGVVKYAWSVIGWSLATVGLPLSNCSEIQRKRFEEHQNQRGFHLKL